MLYNSEFMVVPHLAQGNIYFVFRQLNGGQYLEIEIKIEGLTVFNFNKLTVNEKNFFIKYIFPDALCKKYMCYI